VVIGVDQAGILRDAEAHPERFVGGKEYVGSTRRGSTGGELVPSPEKSEFFA